jgi:hypothetical protein
MASDRGADPIGTVGVAGNREGALVRHREELTPPRSHARVGLRRRRGRARQEKRQQRANETSRHREPAFDALALPSNGSPKSCGRA